jgi:hypothetical protein
MTGNIWRKPALWIAAAVCLAAAIAAGLFIVLHNRSELPAAIRRQVHFGVFMPDSAQARVQPATMVYDGQEQSLSYVSTMTDGTTLTVSEQATPQSFSDIPQAYDKVVDTMNRYAVLDTISGKVYLTKPRNADHKQVAVFNNRGTLLFMRASGNLSDDRWRQLFNGLRLVK